jgi:nitroreductase
MLTFQYPIHEVIRQRYSCRAYKSEPVSADVIQLLAAAAANLQSGPFGTPLRYQVLYATEGDRQALQGLGTYGTIRNPNGFIVGAAGPGSHNLEDYGYQMESLILFATSLGLGSCWIGGFFTRSTFSDKINLVNDEVIPAVTAIGYPKENRHSIDLFRAMSRGATRLPWEKLFFDNRTSTPLTKEQAGPYSTPLEMLRLGPSASNRQPWRVIRQDSRFHFYRNRSQGYGKGTLGYKLGGVLDLQRADIGIAMCHFEYAARECGLHGKWRIEKPDLDTPELPLGYIVSWYEEN